MSIASKNPVLLVALVVGGFLLLTKSRKANAQPVRFGPGATNAKFYQSPSVAGQMQSQQGAAVAGGLFNFLGSIMKPSTSSSSSGRTTLIDSSAGEAQAAAVYQANPGDFQSPDPFAAYSADGVAANVSPSQILPNMGYVDNSEY